MNRKRIRSFLIAAAAGLLCLMIVFPTASMKAQAASKKLKFASSVASTAKKYAKKAGAKTQPKIAVAKVVNYTNIYSKKNTNSLVRGRLYRGAGAYVLKTSGNFCYVSSGKAKGWVKKSVLLTGTEGIQYLSSLNPRVAKVTATDLNVRASASDRSDIVVNLPRGAKVIVTGIEGNWAKVRVTDNNSGYIYRKYANIQSGLYLGVTINQENSMKKKIAAAQHKSEVSRTGQSSGSKDSSSSGETAGSVSGRWVSKGTFKLTAYCPCSQCSGGWGTQTASGRTAVAKHTVAVDRNVIPLGTKIRIGDSDIVYTADDTGVSGKTIDIFFNSHSETRAFGVQYAEIYVLDE